jgi:phenylpyruvate tautomerase PptA (4-oxalocrotonate tautomerase family)
MPFINSKVSVKLTENQKKNLKSQLGQAITCIPGKSESWLMVGIQDNYELYFQGNQNGPTAFVEVRIFGHASPADYDRMTAALCKIYENELGIPKDRIYVTYQEVEHWGWNGGNF